MGAVVIRSSIRTYLSVLSEHNQESASLPRVLIPLISLAMARSSSPSLCLLGLASCCPAASASSHAPASPATAQSHSLARAATWSAASAETTSLCVRRTGPGLTSPGVLSMTPGWMSRSPAPAPPSPATAPRASSTPGASLTASRARTLTPSAQLTEPGTPTQLVWGT